MRQYWAVSLDESGLEDGVDRFGVLEYWGVLDTELAEDANFDLPTDLEDQDLIQVNICVCSGQILRLVLNPFTPVRIPYAAVPYDLNPYSLFGIGVAENMEDTQLLANGFMGMAADNAALSGNLIFEVDETSLTPGQDMTGYLGKIFSRMADAPGQSILSTSLKNTLQENLMMFDKARQLTDEATGVPSYSHGVGGVMGIWTHSLWHVHVDGRCSLEH